MKSYLSLIALCFISLFGFGQKLHLEKASPFTAIKWEGQRPIVRFNNEWYRLEQLDQYPIGTLLDFCRQEYGEKWQKRFSEDLVDVLRAIGSPPNEQVKLVLSSATHKITEIGLYTQANRQQTVAYNKANAKVLQTVTIPQALEDIAEFQQLLEESSSYVHLSDYNYKLALTLLKKTILNSVNDIDINYLSHEMAKIMAEIGDRHSSLKTESIESPICQLQLPFSLAPLGEKAAVIKSVENAKSYEYYNRNFPFLKSINGIPIDKIIDSLVYKSKKAPKEAKFHIGLSEIQKLGRLYFINNLKLPEHLQIVLTNGKTDSTTTIQLQDKQFRYFSKLELKSSLNASAISKGDFSHMATLLKGNIGLISLPEMYSFDKVIGLKDYIDSIFTTFRDTKAIIIDLRFNPGGSRDLIPQFASHIISKANEPWIANVAYLRTNKRDTIFNSMSERLLYQYSSDSFNNLDKSSISAFSKKFVAEKKFDTTKFSHPHYMILESGKEQYKKQIYILVNEGTFSAASVFTSAFKDLSNVKIVGVATDGSSGNSEITSLKHSNIKFTFSTMLSFQRDGKTLDGNGTQPDIYNPENEEQLLKGNDFQLQKLTEIINNN